MQVHSATLSARKQTTSGRKDRQTKRRQRAAQRKGRSGAAEEQQADRLEIAQDAVNGVRLRLG